MSTGDARPERSKEDMKELMTQLNIMIWCLALMSSVDNSTSIFRKTDEKAYKISFFSVISLIAAHAVVLIC